MNALLQSMKTTMTKYHLRPWLGDQDPDELTQFLDFIVERKVKRYLEIGSRNGDSFYAVMMAMGPGAFGMAIDLPENASSKTSLLGTRAEINAQNISFFELDVFRRYPVNDLLINRGANHAWKRYPRLRVPHALE